MNLSNYNTSLEQIYGRKLHSEASVVGRNPFQRDRDRVIHSESFRKLENKTHVFMSSEGDYYRTKLTHSLEVAQIARSISKRFGLNDDFAEAIALASNLGFPPFGNIGEQTLNHLTKSNSNGVIEFNSTIQSMRIISELEEKYLLFNGLNLTVGTMEGVIKQLSPIQKESGNTILLEYCDKCGINANHFPPLESQIVYFASKIAENIHDLDDGLRSNAISMDDIKHIPIVGDVFIELSKKYTSSGMIDRLRHETLRKSMSRMIEQLCEQIEHNLDAMNISSPNDVALANQPIVKFSAVLDACTREMSLVLKEKVYNHFRVCKTANKARRILSAVFEYLLENPKCLPSEWLRKYEKSNTPIVILSDYISSLTDQSILQEWRDCISLNLIDFRNYR